LALTVSGMRSTMGLGGQRGSTPGSMDAQSRSEDEETTSKKQAAWTKAGGWAGR
jgi:hypothetical protein